MQKPLVILGAGKVGLALATAFIAKGQTVLFGVRDLAKYRDAVTALGASANITTTNEAIDAGDIVILSVPYATAVSLASSRADWGGRIVVDATNPLAPGLAGLTVGTTTSAAEIIAAAAKGGRVVKAFNSTGFDNMADSHYPGGKILMPICGDDADARAQVVALAALIGFDALDCGELIAARYIEPFAMTWIHMAVKVGLGRNFAFARLAR
jgi:predicted dinucleotide-binding enzyme